jgi:protein-disulfide isomerase
VSQENLSAKAAKAAAAAARQEAASVEQKRQRKIRIIGGLVVVVVMAALIAIPVLTNKDAVIPADAALPAGVTSDTYGVKVGSAWTAANADKIPLLQVWEDFQCPACARFEEASGAALQGLIDAGNVRVEYRPTIFLDKNLVSANTAAGNPNSSQRATLGFGCAVDANAAEKYHAGVFASQPTDEGAGYSNDTLVSIAESSGITGDALASFTDCLTSEKYAGWVANSYAAFDSAGVSSTPTAFLNGTEVPGDVLFDPIKLSAAIEAAAKS